MYCAMRNDVQIEQKKQEPYTRFLLAWRQKTNLFLQRWLRRRSAAV